MLLFKVLFVTGLLLGLIISVLKLARLRCWTRTEAVCLGIDRGPSVFSTTRYKLSFHTTDGKQITVTLSASAEAGVPRERAEVAIIYDPRKPERAEEYASPVDMLAVGAVALAMMAAIILH